MSSYLQWHYSSVWIQLFIVWRNLTLFPFYYFSVPLHVRTLFIPWKRQRFHAKQGFDLGDFTSIHFFNLTSRVIGAFMRSILIFTGLMLAVLFSIITVIPFLFWTICIGISFPIYIVFVFTHPKTPLELVKASNGNIKLLTITILRHPAGIWTLKRLGLSATDAIQTVEHEGMLGDFRTLETFLYKRGAKPTFPSLFESIALSSPPFSRFLTQQNVTADDLYQTALWYESLQALNPAPVIFDLPRIRAIPGIGTDWAYGYTVEFDRFAHDVTKLPAPYPLLLGMDERLKEIERILVKTERPNVLLIGEPGVARHMLLTTLAYRMQSGRCLPPLSHKRILLMDMHGILSEKPKVAEGKGFVSRLLNEAKEAGNVIVAIDEFDRYVGSGDGRIDLTDVFETFVKDALPCIGITTTESFNRIIDPNPTLSNMFTPIHISPPDPKTLLTQLQLAVVPVLEKKYGVVITYQALTYAIEDADRYLSRTPFPGKAVELLDETCIYQKSALDDPIIRPGTVESYLSQKLHTKVGKPGEQEKTKLAHLEDLLHLRIVNQEMAIRTIAAAMRRARLNLSSPSRPRACFLFLGPTGVGKTETAKALGDLYFGTGALSRFDMSQYQKNEGLERLIGSVKGGSTGELTDALGNKPFSLLLLDEIEKSSPEIYNLFLTLLDEGYVFDATGRRIDAKNTIIIATSNAGAEFIRELIQQGVSSDKLSSDVVDYVQKERIFSPEFLNRFDGVVVFTPLSEGHMKEVAKLMLEALNKRLAKEKLQVTVTDDLLARLVPLGMDREFGARAIERRIAQTVEDALAQKILGTNAQSNNLVTITL